MQQSVFFIGTPEEVAHHAAPLTDIDYQIVAPGNVVDVAQAGDIAIFFSEHFDRFRDACNKLKAKNVATLYMIDGILEWRNAWENRDDEPACPWTMRPVLSHKVACIGDSQARVLESWGNEERVEITGIPRFDFLKSLERVPNSDCFRILVMTAKCPGFTDEQTANTVRALIDLKDYFFKFEELGGKRLEVIWRLTNELEATVGVRNQLTDLTGADLAATLQKVDAVITTPSTAILEAMLMGLPVVSLDYNNSPTYVPTAWQINATEQISTVVPELVSPRAERLFFQQTVLNDSLYSGNASARFGDLITQMLSIAAVQVREGKTLQFPGKLLESPSNPTFKSFQNEKIFSDRGEFFIGDERQLQSELGHARREIQHLNREILQLSSELQQAHDRQQRFKRLTP